jgi:hypothetical protein
MGEARLHVVFGAGQAGRALVAQLAGPGVAVRAVSRHWPVTLAGGIDWRAADAADPEVAADAARGAWVVYQCVMPVNAVAGAVPAVAPGRAGCCRAHRCAAGGGDELMRLRPGRGQRRHAQGEGGKGHESH